MHRNMLPGPSALGGEEREGVTLQPVLMNISGRKVLPRLSASVHGDCYSHTPGRTAQMLTGWKMGCWSCSGQLTFFCCNTGFRRKSERIKSPLKSREKLHLEPRISYLINDKASLSSADYFSCSNLHLWLVFLLKQSKEGKKIPSVFQCHPFTVNLHHSQIRLSDPSMSNHLRLHYFIFFSAKKIDVKMIL